MIGTLALAPVVAGASGPTSSTPAETTTSNTTDDFGAASGDQIESGNPQVSGSLPDERVIPTRVDIERVNGTDTVQFTYTFDLPSDTVQFGIRSIKYIDSYSVVETTGFEEGQEFTWDTTTSTPSITVEHTLPDESNAGMHRVTIPSPSGVIQRGDPPEGRFVDSVYEEPVGFYLDTTARVHGEGTVAGSEFVTGEYTVYTERADGKEISLFVPDRVDMAVSPEKAITALAATERAIEGDPHRDVSVFVLEGQIAAGGASSASAVVHAGSPLSIYIHETAHINEMTYYNRDMAWFTEGSATYYGSYFEPVNGQLEWRPATFLHKTDPETKWPQGDYHEDSTLGEVDTYDRRTSYEKGSRVLFALDVKLREATDGEATIHDVMYRVNQHSGQGGLNYTEFRGIIVDLAGEDTASWLDPYVLTAQNPPKPNASVFGPTPNFADGTTNTSGDARGTFEFAITIPSGEQQRLESATLSIESRSTTVAAVVSDDNDDGRVTVRFQPYGPDGGTGLETADTADEITVTEGTLEDPVVSEELQVKLLVTDASESYTLATRSITLLSIPTETSQTEPPAAQEPDIFADLTTDRVRNLFYEFASSLSPFDLVIGVPLSLAAVLLFIKARTADQ
ncbi:hypothetical protein [Halobaculum roseum]|uniref:Uncharacterized protein n=1 Tax=Halobaculum roseum TaxID=2175149 RepID=A0ABD5MMJ2_9EURY|nr:hypothetical protein [Halobaculum roseum]QZY03420.1 hypothetical protein K6T36_04425 [Halobaculum roseum]